MLRRLVDKSEKNKDYGIVGEVLPNKTYANGEPMQVGDAVKIGDHENLCFIVNCGQKGIMGWLAIMGNCQNGILKAIGNSYPIKCVHKFYELPVGYNLGVLTLIEDYSKDTASVTIEGQEFHISQELANKFFAEVQRQTGGVTC